MDGPTSGRTKPLIELHFVTKNRFAGDYDAIPPTKYSASITSLIGACLTPNPSSRPDVLQVGSKMSTTLLQQLDNLRCANATLERKLERERKRTHRHYVEATRNMKNYHRLFLVSQERLVRKRRRETDRHIGTQRDT